MPSALAAPGCAAPRSAEATFLGHLADRHLDGLLLSAAADRQVELAADRRRRDETRQIHAAS
jgi:hypothetical protein